MHYLCQALSTVLNFQYATLELSDEDIHLLVTALEHYYAYTVAKKGEDTRYRDLAERLKRKPTEREPARPAKEKKRRA